ncbi:hypothetical protein ABZ532_24215 [Streptomyces sp. NPDC019396]|uniref:hypothetical protein n=1 Tax=Streptomyces sp. NPDC019396 TaxID=3154687 RepID=UPI0033E8BBEB
MPKKHPAHGEGPSRFKGREQHGWAEDVDDKDQNNPSAHRSFHPDTYAPGPEKSGQPTEAEKEASLAGTEIPSEGRSGEGRAGETKEPGMHDKGRRGRSQRPSGSKDSSAFTGIDPQEPKSGNAGS